jgi:hypothetical protein
MKIRGKILVILAAGAAFLASSAAAEPGRIYGKIHTTFGDVLEGPIRWDKNEVGWNDIIDGSKHLDRRNKESKRRKYRGGKRINLFGVTVYQESDSWWGSTAQSGIAVGHIKRLVPESDDAAMLELKNGEEVLLENSSTDLGSGMRELVIEAIGEGELELDWRDIDFIEFFDGGDVESNFGTRLYGTVTTRRSGDFTGFISWDVDEAFTEDKLDGEERRRKRSIEFGDIASIERVSSRSSMVTLKSGRELRLDGTNDVDSGNRGIVISDNNLGRIVVNWDEFEDVKFIDPPREAYPRYDEYDGGKRLFGTVTTDDGETFTGYIRWDDDEEYGWELLDGELHDVEIDIEFRNLKSIEKLSRRSSRATLWDGREFRLRNSNDVNDENKGIIIMETEDGEDEIYIDWDEFDKIEFRKS